MHPRSTPLALVSIAALAIAACQSSELTSNGNPLLDVLPGITGDGGADPEEFELCKFGSSGTFSYSIVAYGGPNKTNPGAPQVGSGVAVAAGTCVIIAQFGGNGADVTVTETSAQSGFHLARVDITIAPGGATSTVAGPSVTEFIGGTSGGGPRGALAEFFNEADEGGGEGCTPGYWKQEHHFDSWPAGILPTDLFSAYFEDAFPGKTLLEVLSAGGGQLIALGRHTVAALLNAASTGVDYDLSIQQVKDEFNAVFPSSSYNTQAGRFEGFNQAGCPLN